MTLERLAGIPPGSRVYLDTNIWIYALEGFDPHVQPLTALLGRIDAGELAAVTSELTLAELLVKPLQTGLARLQQTYLDTLQSGPTLTVAPITRAILVDAARLRAQQPALKLPDAIHAATALACDAPIFVTNDARFSAVDGLTAIVLHAGGDLPARGVSVGL
jgi:predicted nucleic acid-binding protein